MGLQQAHPRAGLALLDRLFEEVRKSIPPCSISAFIAHGKGSSGRAISGPLPGLEGLPRGELVSCANAEQTPIKKLTAPLVSGGRHRRQAVHRGLKAAGGGKVI